MRCRFAKDGSEGFRIDKERHVPRKREMIKLGSLENTLEVVRAHLPALRRRYKIGSLSVFGSYARSEERRRSDVDILVEFDQPPTLFEFMDLQDELSQLLGVKVDLVSRKALRGEVGKRILEEAVAV